MSLGPRACATCGPGQIAGCFRCGSTLGHCHVTVTDRAGRAVGRVAACEVHRSVPVQPGGARPSGDDSRIAKRVRDRERRQAQRVVLDRHADEVAQVLDEIRQGAGDA